MDKKSDENLIPDAIDAAVAVTMEGDGLFDAIESLMGMRHIINNLLNKGYTSAQISKLFDTAAERASRDAKRKS